MARNGAMPSSPEQRAEQNIHHFMSLSPRAGAEVIQQMQEKSRALPVFTGAVLDESASEQSGGKPTRNDNVAPHIVYHLAIENDHNFLV